MCSWNRVVEVRSVSNTLEANERSLEKTTFGELELVALTFESLWSESQEAVVGAGFAWQQLQEERWLLRNGLCCYRWQSKNDSGCSVGWGPRGGSWIGPLGEEPPSK